MDKKNYKSLREEFKENPFSILDVSSSEWQRRKKEWLKLGLGEDVGRENLRISKGIEKNRIMSHNGNNSSYVSVFDPYLTELMYTWFCKDGKINKILDPFSGGVVRGIVAYKMGHNYLGIDLRKEQIDSNNEIINKIIKEENTINAYNNDLPKYIVGDSLDKLDYINDNEYDLIFTCPPYYNLEIYSNNEKDLSNMSWEGFKTNYYEIIKKSSAKLKKGGYAVIVIGDVRMRNGGYYGLVPYTIKSFMECGMQYYNEMILRNPIASAAVRARQGMKYQKIVKIHQNVLVFKKARVNNKENKNILS